MERISFTVVLHLFPFFFKTLHDNSFCFSSLPREAKPKTRNTSIAETLQEVTFQTTNHLSYSISFISFLLTTIASGHLYNQYGMISDSQGSQSKKRYTIGADFEQVDQFQNRQQNLTERDRKEKLSIGFNAAAKHTFSTICKYFINFLFRIVDSLFAVGRIENFFVHISEQEVLQGDCFGVK